MRTKKGGMFRFRKSVKYTPSSKTELNDRNIHYYVRQYMTNKPALPADLQVINDWDVSKVTNMKELFLDLEFNEPLDKWDVSNVTNMSNMFEGCTNFDQPLPWDVSKVTNMYEMFGNCHNFNQPLAWDVSKVTTMESMFFNCVKFNQPLHWDVSKVTDMGRMFFSCSSFNQLLNWDVSKVTDMYGVFFSCNSFNQLLNWDVSKVTNMHGMFSNCNAFNQPLHWDVSKVTQMGSMFSKCENFNQPLNWDVSKVTDMSGMFFNCEKFNQPLHWDVSDVRDMHSMFAECEEFNQPLDWVVRLVLNMENMFKDCSSFKQQLFWKLHRDCDTTDMFEGCATKSLYDILPSPLSTIDEPILVPYMDVQDITLDEPLKTKESYNEYFRDKNNIVLRIQTTSTPTYLLVSRDQLHYYMDLKDAQNGLVFICNGEHELAFEISRDILKSLNPYFNLRKVGGFGYVSASQIQSILNDDNQLYVLSQVDQAISVASWGMYILGIENAVSGSHCQKGSGGTIYNVEIGRFQVPSLQTLARRSMHPEELKKLDKTSLKTGGKKRTRRSSNA